VAAIWPEGIAMLKGLLGRLFGAGGEVEIPAEEYNGYRIRPTPYARNRQFQTCGVIEKDFPDGSTKEHRFVRAEMHATREAAVEFAKTKARQIIDQQGDRIFQ
jgi:hypothetical protein